MMLEGQTRIALVDSNSVKGQPLSREPINEGTCLCRKNMFKSIAEGFETLFLLYVTSNSVSSQPLTYCRAGIALRLLYVSPFYAKVYISFVPRFCMSVRSPHLLPQQPISKLLKQGLHDHLRPRSHSCGYGHQLLYKFVEARGGNNTRDHVE